MNEACIEWRGAKTSQGYGQVWRGRGRHPQYAHRWAYEKFHGPIPEGLFVLHSCDNPPCINPAHLRVGTAADNIADKTSRGRDWQQKKTHCPRGHILAPPNLVESDLRRGRRRCRICHNNVNRLWQRRKTARMRSAMSSGLSR